MVLDWMKLLASVDDMILRQDTSSRLLASIGFHNCLMCFIKLSENGSWEE